ncbi:MAG: aldo/keto reductase [Planctomycetes bacterium]|nr:aldo/keto reductase [Planctomycetota bacterium]
MQYDILGKTELKVSRLGFGCMRLPMKDKTEVDREKAIPMLHRARELGINLFDTAVGYCAGDSQRTVGEAFENVRDKIVLSTKNHHYDKNDKDGWWKHLENSLERLRTDHIDIYNHHGINYNRYQESVAGDDGLYQEMLKAKEQGLIRHICFSFHGPNDQLMKLVDTGRFDTVICQYNLLDRHLEDAIAHASESGMGVLIMGPVGGGRLGYPSDKAASLVGEVKSTPDLALRFVLSNENVNVALSGMSNMQMLEENVETVSSAEQLSEKDHQQIEEAIEERKKLAGLYCTGCNYCMPCPAGVDIPANFQILNLERVFGLTDHAKKKYGNLEGKAAYCMQCGQCLEECPQDINIPQRLGEAVKTLDPRAGRLGGWSYLRSAERTEETTNLQIRYVLKNFADETRNADLQFQPQGEDRVQPQKLTVEELEPYHRKKIDLELSQPRNVSSYNLDVVVSWDGEITTEHLSEMVVCASRTEGFELKAGEIEGPVHVPAPTHPTHSTDYTPETTFDFGVCYDEQNLYIGVDVDAADEEEDVGPVMVYLDTRKPEELGRGSYEEGVTKIALHPPAETEKAGAETDLDLELDHVATDRGYAFACAIPWEELCQDDDSPSVAGFDIGLRCQVGEKKVLLNWTGRPGGDKDPSAFGKLAMV